MDDDLRRACRRAGLKLGVGLAFVGVLVGLRIVTATPVGLEQDLAELEQHARTIAAQAPVGQASQAQPAAGAAGASAVDRPGSEGDRGEGGRASSSAGSLAGSERLVSCRLAERVQFMRADDCAHRGGRARVVSP